MNEGDGENWDSDPTVPTFLKEPPVAPRSSSVDELLRQILKEQRETNRMLAKIGVLLRQAVKNQSQAQATAPSQNVGPAVDLDSERGNFRVNKDPPKWTGESFAGKLLSECSTEFLDELARFYEWRIWKAEQTLKTTPDDDKAQKTIKYTPTDVARIKGWAARIRNGYGGGSPTQQQTSDGGSAPEPDMLRL